MTNCLKPVIAAKSINLFLKVLAVIFITLALLEIVLRLSGLFTTANEKAIGTYRSPYNQHLPSWYFLHEPNISFCNTHFEFSYHHSVDSQGLIRSNSSKTAADKIQILIMGDSYTFGFGAPQDSSWPVLLAQICKIRCHTNIEIVNASMPGSDVFFEYQLYKDKISKIVKPDIILLMLNSTDIHEVAIRGGMERFKSDGTTSTLPAPWFEPLYHYSHAARYFLKIFFGINNEFLFRNKEEYEFLNNAANKIKQCIAKFEKEAQRNRSVFMAVSFPTPREIEDPLATPESYRRLIAGSHSYLNLDTVMNEYYKCHDINNGYWHIDGHFNSNGYKVMSEKIYEMLILKNEVINNSCNLQGLQQVLQK